MAKERKVFKGRLREFTVKALKATIKATIFYGGYFVVSMFLAPLWETVPGFQQTIEIFVMVYISLMIIGDLTAGTIFHDFFDGAKALFVIPYLILTLKDGTVHIPLQNLYLVVELRFFLIIGMLLSVLRFAEVMIQAINFLNTKAEHESRQGIKQPRYSSSHTPS